MKKDITMRKNNLRLVIILIYILTKVTPAFSQSKGNIAFILCDFTTSIDSTVTTQAVLTNLNTTLNNLPQNTEYYIYIVSRGAKGEFTHGYITSDYEETINHIGASLGKAKRVARGPKENVTCLNVSLEVAANNIRSMTQGGNYRKIYLITLSDMLLACKWGNQFVNLEEHQYSQANNALRQWCTNSRKTLYNIPNLDVLIVLSAQRTERYSELVDFWKSYFKQTGYPHNPDIVVSINKNSFR
jgi:hypothetical protein